jgi:hypothetical protein
LYLQIHRSLDYKRSGIDVCRYRICPTQGYKEEQRKHEEKILFDHKKPPLRDLFKIFFPHLENPSVKISIFALQRRRETFCKLSARGTVCREKNSCYLLVEPGGSTVAAQLIDRKGDVIILRREDKLSPL